MKTKFRFVNTHFEAFDDETQVPSIRAQQATGGASPGRRANEAHDHARRLQLRTSPAVQPGDEQAFQTLLDAGFERARRRQTR